MHPRDYHQTFLRYQASDEVFVARPFTPRFDKAYDTIIEPAIRSVLINGKPVRPRIVNRSTTDSADIQTEICNGVLHCRLIVADMTVQGVVVDGDRTSWQPNANVAYEVGLTAAWRNPQPS